MKAWIMGMLTVLGLGLGLVDLVHAERTAKGRDAESAGTEASGAFFPEPPIKNSCITSPHGPRKLDGRYDFHSGCDFRAAVGTPLQSPGPGRVTAVGSTAFCGKYVEIAFDKPKVFGHFCHMSSTGVKVGQSVEAGQFIGKSGDSGGRPGRRTPPHLHFVLKPKAGMNNLKQPGNTYNPEQYFKGLEKCS
jgi:murein DD-endopeptidase MepM/ murein hydrolase activator NlpD